ncbi:hypothetical protein ATN84_16305 [Paramesorhizobium deserti]|uniref:Uncharacterized protein n=1 Tax=Paramesorhizobium deserti TaxID=1494590 RepID=A0A135HTA2_9HYPH|nr:hypothetical protein ATN84_16305 [Paramesorhizobium deserti]
MRRQITGDIHMSGVAGLRQMPLGEAKAQKSPVFRKEMKILATKYLSQCVGRHPDLAAADHFRRLPQETVKIVVYAEKCLAGTFQDTSPVNSTKVLHE